jgi:hypothetical protein
VITITEVIEQCAKMVEPTDAHRNNPYDYISGREAVEVLELLANNIRALAAQYEGCIVADGEPVAEVKRYQQWACDVVLVDAGTHEELAGKLLYLAKEPKP